MDVNRSYHAEVLSAFEEREVRRLFVLNGILTAIIALLAIISIAKKK